MTDHTAPDLLEAVGVDWRKKYGRILCAECGMTWRSNDTDRVHFSACRRPDTSNIAPTYTGPALGTPELDVILLVAGLSWLRANNKRRFDIYTALHKMYGDGKSTTVASVAIWLIEECDTPGHALARAIAEVRG